MLSILNTALILYVFFLQLSSSAVIRRDGPNGLHHLTAPSAAPTALSTAVLHPTLTAVDEDNDTTEPDDGPDDDEDDGDDGDDEDDEDDEEEDDSTLVPPSPTKGHPAAPKPTTLSPMTAVPPTPTKAAPKPTTLSPVTAVAPPSTKGQTATSKPTLSPVIVLPPTSTKGKSAAPKSTTLSPITVLPPTSTKGKSAAPKSTTLSPITALPPTSTKGQSAAPKPTTLSPVVVLPSTSTKGHSAAPKPTTLSTVTVVPVPKTSSAAAQPVASASGATAGGQVWKPTAGTTWQIELSGTVSDLTYAVDVFDVDLFDTPAATIKTLKGNGKKVICYFSAGSFEDWRPDRASFQASDKGSPMQGWPGEFWLDTKSANVRSIMATRIKMAQDKGCDGVDPDNVDAYDNQNGLGLSQPTAVDFVQYMANEAHSRGLSIGLKNAGNIVNEVLHLMEWHVNEQCVQYGDCNQLVPFIAANKPVFHIEYPDGAPNITPDVKTKNCNAPSAKGFSTVLKTIDLNAWVDPCT